MHVHPVVASDVFVLTVLNPHQFRGQVPAVSRAQSSSAVWEAARKARESARSTRFFQIPVLVSCHLQSVHMRRVQRHKFIFVRLLKTTCMYFNDTGNCPRFPMRIVTTLLSAWLPHSKTPRLTLRRPTKSIARRLPSQRPMLQRRCRCFAAYIR